MKKVGRKNKELKSYNEHGEFDKSDHMVEFKD